ncbi:VWA domain-containing protein [Cytobacillus sp. FJAT-53684]|uniref:VWA domain-containing protein n=1 Tax=Cytobacillus mangrovibacter TaxID=3299024 RepID=A0ABW6K6C5_9BACI
MRKKSPVLVILLLGCMLLTACSEKQTESGQQQEPNEKEKQTQLEDKDEEEQETVNLQEQLAELPEPSMTVTEFVHTAPGLFSGKRYDDLTSEEQNEIVNILRELPKVGDDPSEEEIELYWRKSLSLFHEDFPNPANVLDQVAIEAFGSPDTEDERYQFKEQLNVEIILDASGSMGNLINGKTMMDMAKESIKEFADSLPEGANIALRVYGHKGTGANKDKELSCKSNELIYEMQSYDQNVLNNALSQIKPAGWTPLAKAMELAKDDLSQYKSDKNTNIIYLVSDGVETCNGDPVNEAKKLADSDIQPIVNVIGFDLDAKGQQQLKEVAAAAKGMYNNARNQEELKQELQKARMIAEKWQEWKKDATYTVKMNRNDQFLKNIPSFNIEWSEANGNEDMNILQPLRVLRDEGHISKAAFQQLSAKSSERFSQAIELGEQIESDLRNLADQNLEQAKEEINKKYDSNVE